MMKAIYAATFASLMLSRQIYLYSTDMDEGAAH